MTSLNTLHLINEKGKKDAEKNTILQLTLSLLLMEFSLLYPLSL